MSEPIKVIIAEPGKSKSALLEALRKMNCEVVPGESLAMLPSTNPPKIKIEDITMQLPAHDLGMYGDFLNDQEAHAQKLVQESYNRKMRGCFTSGKEKHRTDETIRAFAPVKGGSSPCSAVVSSTAPGRNDPCSCGSGKKYKKCCGR